MSEVTSSTTNHTTVTEVVEPVQPCVAGSHTEVNEIVDHTETSKTTTITFGPATILIGENQSETLFVEAGTVNVNTNTHTESFVTRTVRTVCDPSPTTPSPVAEAAAEGAVVAIPRLTG